MTNSRNGGSRKWRDLCARKKREWLLARSVIDCHLCLRQIDVAAKPRTPDSLSYDHIEPVSQRPDLEFRADNVAPSHWACNIARQDQPVDHINGTELRLTAFRARIDAKKAANAVQAAEAGMPALGRSFYNGMTWDEVREASRFIPGRPNNISSRQWV